MARCELSKKPPRKRGKRWSELCSRVDASDAEHHRTAVAMIGLHLAKRIDLRKPTKYRPGSPEKVAVLAARYAIGMMPSLHADGDINHNEACLVHGTTLPLDRPTFAACEIREVLET